MEEVMDSIFTTALGNSYSDGKFYLGRDFEKNLEIGFHLERHVVTVAGSGTGKGSALIIPNLLRWPSNALVIDTGGGNTINTWEKREEIGQQVHVIDPARLLEGKIPERLFKHFNPLQNLNSNNRTYIEDISAIADGLVMRHDPRHAYWDNAGRDIITGIIDYFVTRIDDSDRILKNVRDAILQPPEQLKLFFSRLSEVDMPPSCRAGAAIILGDLERPNGLIANALENTAWLNYKSMIDTLSASTCDLSEIRTQDCTIYLVIHPDYLIEHARFLRLFVRVAISAMAKGGEEGKKCLFILDEFFSLGKIDYLEKAAGLMRKNGVHLWPILQNFNQLSALYSLSGADNFLANSDLLIFFGLDHDVAGQEYVSSRFGKISAAELITEVPKAPGPSYFFNYNDEFGRFLRDRDRANYETTKNRYDHLMKNVDFPRLTPQDIATITGKRDGDSVSRSMIVLGKAGIRLNLKLCPFFEIQPTKQDQDKIEKPEDISNSKAITANQGCLSLIFATVFVITATLVVMKTLI